MTEIQYRQPYTTKFYGFYFQSYAEVQAQYADDGSQYAEMILTDLASRMNPTYWQYLENKFRSEIESGWQWDEIESDCRHDEFAEAGIGRCYLGTVFQIMPSGKYWNAFAAGNVDSDEAFRDTVYTETLEDVFASHGFGIESGEGDPCDLFATMEVETDEDEDED